MLLRRRHFFIIHRSFATPGSRAKRNLRMQRMKSRIERTVAVARTSKETESFLVNRDGLPVQEGRNSQTK
jgi:hypothetical protein